MTSELTPHKRLPRLPLLGREKALLLGALVLLLSLIWLKGEAIQVSPMVWSRLHLMLEILAFSVALMVFFLTWSTRRWGQPFNQTVAGIMFLGGAMLNMGHLVFFPVLDEATDEHSMQIALSFWVGEQGLIALALLAGALLPSLDGRSLRLTLRWTLGLVAAGSATFGLLALSHDGGLPIWWSAQQGISQAKAWSEWLILSLYALSVVVYFGRAQRERSSSNSGLAAAALILALSEWAFTTHIDDSSLVVVLGHLYKVLGFYLVYLALFQEGVQVPHRKVLDSEQHLRESRAAYRELFSSSPDGLLVINAHGLIERINPSVTRLFGWPDTELVGQAVEVLIPEPYRTHHVHHRNAFLHDPSARQMGGGRTLKALRKDGTQFFIEVALVPQPELAGRRSTLVILRDISHRKELEHSLMVQATHDSLTELPNRRHFQDTVSSAIDKQGADFALLFIDLDQFKAVNDNLGHSTGDELLKLVGRRMSNVLRAGDMLARMGGDEFAILINRADSHEEATLVAERILNTLTSPMKIGIHEVTIGASIGVTHYPRDGRNLEELLCNADVAMYKAKSTGRNRWCLFTPDMNERVREQLFLEHGLRQAIANHEFVLHYQPRVRSSDGSLTGFEALLRWVHPERGLISPEHFIPVAEGTGQIELIGEWVLAQACTQAMQWQQQGLPPTLMAVNISARQLRSPLFAQRVMQTLASSGFEPHLLELELTETALMEDRTVSASVLKELAALGVKTAIDDFGTGYSSLAYLKTFPLSRLKVDRSFVSGVDANADDRVLTSTVIVLAHSLGLQVTAEGVETPEQVRFLRQQGCDEMQGYFFARPLSAEACGELLRRGASAGEACTHTL